MPEGVTPETMCDWAYMTGAIAAMEPLAPPGEKTLYQSMTFGWIVGEIVRRSDPVGRDFHQYVLDEIAAPLGLADLWIGIPDAVEDRIADRKRVVSGKRVSVRVDLGGRRIIKKKTKKDN